MIVIPTFVSNSLRASNSKANEVWVIVGSSLPFFTPMTKILFSKFYSLRVALLASSCVDKLLLLYCLPSSKNYSIYLSLVLYHSANFCLHYLLVFSIVGGSWCSY